MDLLGRTRMHFVCHLSGKGVSAGKMLTVAFVLAFAVAGLAALPTVESAKECDPPGVASALRTTFLETTAQGEEPEADAGGNRTAFVGAIVSFDGSDSTDDFGIVNYTWTIEDDGVHTLYGSIVSYTFWTAGNFTVSLNVTDGDGHWDIDVISVLVAADTEPPVAAGANRTVLAGELVELSAVGSTDNARIINYTWEFEYDREDVVLYGEAVQFWFNRSGTYEALLTVTDASGLTNSTTVMIQVNEEPTWLSQNWLKLAIAALLLSGPVWLIVAKYRKDRTLITKSDIEKLHLQLKNLRKIWKQFRTRLGAMFGLYLLLFFLVAALFAPWLGTDENPNDIGWARVREQYLPPSIDNLFGTDFYGRDVYSLTIYGARASLIVGILASLISIILGTVIGVGAGYFGKVSDEILMRVTDFFLVLPWFPLMIVIASLLGRSFTNVIIVIGITSWPSTARIVRAQVMSVKEMGFIERARSIGCRDGHIIQKHVLPNVFPLIFANTILLIANSIFSEAFLDFFGLGDPNVISWGVMLEEAYQYGAFTSFAWWWILAPGACIVLLIMAFYLIGDALDEIFNPRLRKR